LIPGTYTLTFTKARYPFSPQTITIINGPVENLITQPDGSLIFLPILFGQ
jgi:hypothetical protein